jgi:heterodisulfide reductase subunit A-like polyferredoxin
MALWFVRGIARRVVTTKYPAVIDPWTAALPTPPSFDVSLLDVAVAERLIEVCPSHALWRDGQSLVFDVGACTACGACQRAAPEAVTSSGEFELAANESAQLVKRIPIRGIIPS